MTFEKHWLGLPYAVKVKIRVGEVMGIHEHLVYLVWFQPWPRKKPQEDIICMQDAIKYTILVYPFYWIPKSFSILSLLLSSSFKIF